ncbi:MAG: isopenicillin N synthase family dioxygenase [Bdellovibrionales bacterium]
MSSERKVPELSLSSYTQGSEMDKSEFVTQLFSGLKEYGFIILKDHNVPTEQLDRAYKLSEDFFSLDQEVKNKYVIEGGKFQRGYTPFGKEHAKDAEVHDLKEFWHVGRELPEDHTYSSEYPLNIWADENVPDFKSTFHELYSKLDDTAAILLSAIGEALKVPSNYFSDMIQDGNSILRLLHYPPVPEGADPRCVRAAAHEDINLITILVAATATGLELKDRDGTWLPVETEKNNLIVDAGDMLQRITNMVIPSTTHRVVNPGDGTNNHRYSMPFFCHPHPRAELKCIDSCLGDGAKWEPVSSHDFLMQRLKEIGLS